MTGNTTTAETACVSCGKPAGTCFGCAMRESEETVGMEER